MSLLRVDGPACILAEDITRQAWLSGAARTLTLEAGRALRGGHAGHDQECPDGGQALVELGKLKTAPGRAPQVAGALP